MKSLARLVVGLLIVFVIVLNVSFDWSWGKFLFIPAFLYGSLWGLVHFAAARRARRLHNVIFLAFALPALMCWAYMFWFSHPGSRALDRSVALIAMFFIATVVPAYVGYAYATSPRQEP